MSEDKTPGTSIAVQERPIAHSPVAIWDDADFAQMQRVAVVLVRSGLVPDTLARGKWLDEKGKEVEGYLDERVVAARCTLVCNQARLWGADPLNVLQCTSLINGRLMYEGKLIAAVVTAMTGVKLRYRFGLWDTDHITFPEDESGLYGAAERLAIRCYDPEDEERFVDGSVGLWKTTRTGSPWSNSNAWPRQLRYRASREWARAYEPGVILGILADGDQEIDDLTIEAKPVGLLARLKGEQTGDGFDAAHVEEQTRSRRSRKSKPEPEVSDVLEGDDIPEHLRRLAGGMPVTVLDSYEKVDPATGEVIGDLPQDAAPIVEEPSDTQASATDASGGSQEESRGSPDTEASTSGGPESPVPWDEGQVMMGYPSPGEVYHLVGDTWDEEDRRDTYKDGTPFSTAGRAKGLAIYEDHASEAEAAPEAPTSSEQPSNPEPDLPPDFAAYIDRVEVAETWVEFLEAMKVFYATDTFKGMGDDAQNRVRAQTWGLVLEMGGADGDRVDPAADISAYRLMIEYLTDEDAIEGTFAVLRKSESYIKAPVNAQSSLQLATKRRLTKLRGE